MELLAFIGLTVFAFSLPVFVMKFGKEWLIGLLPIYLITANVFANSFVVILGLYTSLAVPIYAACFVVTDLLSEHYSKSDAKRALLVGFMGQVFFLCVLLVIVNSADSVAQTYKDTFSFLPRLIVGSFVAYLVSNWIDILIYHAIMKKTGRSSRLWLRNNVSTFISQFVDTTIFLAIAFWGVAPVETFGKFVGFLLTTWLLKVAVATLDTASLYASKHFYKSTSAS